MKTAKQLNLTKTQHKNLAKLTIFVRDKVAPPKFNIRWFFTSKEDRDHGHCCDDSVPNKDDYSCGTSACFLGYGVLAGIKPRKEENWKSYGERFFGVKMAGDWFNGSDDKYNLLFNDLHKNSKSAAVKRGAYFLMNGIPENADLSKWETPRSFKPDWEAIEELANS